MRVITAKPQDFDIFFKKISDEIINESDILIIGVANGGVPLQIGLEDYLNKRNVKFDHAVIRCQRPSTEKKKSNSCISFILRWFLRWLPYFILDFLRVKEHEKLSKRVISSTKRKVFFEENPKACRYGSIVVIDDAADSGVSLKEIDLYLNEILSFNSIKYAVYVVTQNNLVFEPSIYIHKNVLVRFPWSLDYKEVR